MPHRRTGGQSGQKASIVLDHVAVAIRRGSTGPYTRTARMGMLWNGWPARKGWSFGLSDSWLDSGQWPDLLSTSAGKCSALGQQYTLHCLPKNLQGSVQHQDTRLSLLGNSWNATVVTWLLGQLSSLGADPTSVSATVCGSHSSGKHSGSGHIPDPAPDGRPSQAFGRWKGDGFGQKNCSIW